MNRQYAFIGFGVINALLLCTAQGSFCPEVREKHLFEIGETCYQYIEDGKWRVTFDASENDCNSRKGMLLTIPDNKTSIEVEKWLNKVSDSHTILLGLRKNNENEWKWSSGDAMTFEKFDKTQRTGSGDDCVKLKLMGNSVWEKFPCQGTDWYTAYVCEYNQRSADIASGQGSFGSYIWIAVSTLLMATVCLMFNSC